MNRDAEADLATTQARIHRLEDQLADAEQELKAAADIITEQEVTIECQRLQLEAADLSLDEAAETRRKLERRIADLEDEHDDPCLVSVPVPREQAPSQQPGYPPNYTPNPVVEAMIARFQPSEKK